MAINKEIQEKFLYLWDDLHIIEWIETFIKIVNKQGKLVPFILTPEQRYFVENMANENCILKFRQGGITSVVVALSIRTCIINDDTNCLLVSHSQPSTTTVFDKLKKQFNSLPEWLKPELDTNNRQELKFKNGSKITCQTAGNKEIGRGDTFGSNSIIHLSEFAFWKNPEIQLSSLSQAVSGGNIIIESTANGFNKFSEIYYQAKNNENSYKSFFFGWIQGGTLFSEQYKEFVKKYKAQKGKLLTVDDLNDEEKTIYNMGASLTQLMWRSVKVSNDGKEKFKVEFPMTDSECFKTTGQQIFSNEKIDEVEKSLLIDKIKHLLRGNITDLPTILKNHYNTSLKIYSLPKKDMKYYLGVDCAEGLGGTHDYSTIVVLDGNGEEVAMFKNNRLKPYQFTDIVDALGRYYNKGYLTIEKASGGHSVIERLWYDKKYMNIHKYQPYDKQGTMHWERGFDMNSKTKSLVINDCIEWFETGLFKLRSKEILEEMKVFVSSSNGKMGAMQGRHDDLVIALCLAVCGMKSRFYYPF